MSTPLIGRRTFLERAVANGSGSSPLGLCTGAAVWSPARNRRSACRRPGGSGCRAGMMRRPKMRSKRNSTCSRGSQVRLSPGFGWIDGREQEFPD